MKIFQEKNIFLPPPSQPYLMTAPLCNSCIHTTFLSPQELIGRKLNMWISMP